MLILWLRFHIPLPSPSPLQLFIATGALLFFIVVLVVFPQLLAPSRAPSDLVDPNLGSKDRIQFSEDRRKLQNDIRAALLQAIGGAALIVGLFFTWQQQHTTSQQVARQLEVTQQGQAGERFSRAIGQLGGKTMEAKLGGIYELEQLARQAKDRRLVIFDVLAAYIRQHPPPALPACAVDTTPLKVRAPDVQAALTVLGRRKPQPGDPPIDLSSAKICGADLEGADLSGAYLLHADLSGANLDNADLRGAELTRADLSDTYLGYTKLQGAKTYVINATSTTKWPQGFDWEKAGVHPVGD
jgi:hypothetical protein